jgi:hypothetical protein
VLCFVLFLLDSTYERERGTFIFVRLGYFTNMITASIHFSANIRITASYNLYPNSKVCLICREFSQSACKLQFLWSVHMNTKTWHLGVCLGKLLALLQTPCAP